MEAHKMFWTSVVFFVLFIGNLFEGKFKFAAVMFFASFFFWGSYVYKTDPPKDAVNKPRLTTNKE